MKLYRRIDTTTGFFIEDALFETRPILTEIVQETQPVFDEQGNVIGENIVNLKKPVLDADGNTIPDPQYIDAECPGGFYKPRWDGTQWIEGLTQIEIDAIKNVTKEPTEEERISALEDAMLYLI